MIPEGIIVNWQARRHRLDPVAKVREFDRKYLPPTEEQKPSPETQEENKLRTIRMKMTEEQVLEEGVGDQQEDSTMIYLDPATGAKRKTRAINPVYKQ